MNEIEQRFFDAFVEYEEPTAITVQVPIGIYIADFVLYKGSLIPSVIEIDGHEFHKTKEQRFADYKKERYFMSEGYLVIRFMGSEVFVNAEKCVEEAVNLACAFDEKCLDSFEKGCECGRESR